MRNFLRGVYVIWYRDLLRFWRSKTRAIGGMIFPILWLLVFGLGISSSLSLPMPGVKYIDFLFPGVIAQFLIFVAMFSAISILQDREFGFLKEIFVSPISRTAIALGKILGGATTASIQVLPVLLLGAVAGVDVSVKMILVLIPTIVLVAITLSALGVALVARVKSLDTGQYIFQFIMFPLVMLSGAFFPLQNLPGWLNILTKINPLSYAVDLLRRIVFRYAHVPDEAVRALSPTINGEFVFATTELVIVATFTILLIYAAGRLFKKAY